METFESIREDFSLVLENRKGGSLPLELAKEQYLSLMRVFTEKIQKEDYALDLEDFKITPQTTFQEFESKLECIINFIEIHFLSEMGTIQ